MMNDFVGVMPTLALILITEPLKESPVDKQLSAPALRSSILKCEESRRKLKDELLEYCKLDTLTMVRLAKFFEAV
jgi:hypothetical protein